MTRDNDASYEQLLEEERLILAATELVVAALEEQGVTRTELARRVGTTKGNISQLLSGERNLTLRSLSQLLFQLGLRAKVTMQPISGGTRTPDFRVGTMSFDVKSTRYSTPAQHAKWMAACAHAHDGEGESLHRASSYRELQAAAYSRASGATAPTQREAAVTV